MIIIVELIAPNCYPSRRRPLFSHTPFDLSAMQRSTTDRFLFEALYRRACALNRHAILLVIYPAFEIEMKSNVPFDGVTGSRVKCFVRSPCLDQAFRTLRND